MSEDGLTRDQINDFPGLTDPVVKTKLLAARTLGARLSMRFSPQRSCSIEFEEVGWHREGDTHNQAAAAALSALEKHIGRAVDSEPEEA